MFEIFRKQLDTLDRGKAEGDEVLEVDAGSH